MRRLAELRKEKHLNQTGLAMKLNISQYLVSAYENDRHQPTTEMLIKIADFFHVSVDYLIGKSDIRLSADYLNNLTDKETKMLNIFKTLPPSKQEQALGVLITLQQID